MSHENLWEAPKKEAHVVENSVSQDAGVVIEKPVTPEERAKRLEEDAQLLQRLREQLKNRPGNEQLPETPYGVERTDQGEPNFEKRRFRG